jgi:carboxyl-terminal processing protease
VGSGGYPGTVTISGSGRDARRRGKRSTPFIVVGSLLCALGLTALGDTQAQAGRADPRRHTRLVPSHDATELRILDWALWNVSKYYVEPERIDPKAMTLAALEALEQNIAEVLVEPVADGKRVRVRVGTAEREFPLGDIEALWAVGPHVREVFRFVNRNTKLTEDDQQEAEYAIVAGVLETLDPHTNLLRPDDFEDMKASTKGSFGGLGIEVGMRDGVITVIRVIEDNPAAKVDMRPGDRIVQIDGESTVTMTLNEAVGRLRGPAGTAVTVYVMRDGLGKPKPLEITRATIQLDSVIGDVLVEKDEAGKEHKVGLVQIPRNFSQTTGKELRAKLDEFEKAQVEGVILDLRDNPGGLLNAAVEVADAFLASGTIVATVGVSSPREENRADDRYDFADLPLVVLIDQGSASASEIVAGALRNQGRAVLLGRRSFGKGSVQVLHERKAGDKELALKLTIAQYLTPGDVSIQSVGVSPDLETIPVWIGEDHVAYYGRERFDLLREESLTAHLESQTAKAQKISYGPLFFLDRGSVEPGKSTGEKDDEKRLEEAIEAKTKRTPLRDADKKDDGDKRTEILLEDPEVRIARDLVLWAPSSHREEILAKMSDFVGKSSDTEAERIKGSLSARGVDWSKGTKPKTGAARLAVALKSDKAGNVIKGGERGTVTVTVTNEGDAPAWQVRAITESDYRYFDERELVFGKLEPGESKSFSIKLSVGEHELSRTDRIDFHFYEQFGAKLVKGAQSWIDVSAEGLARPQFAYGYQVIDRDAKGTEIDGNGDGALQVGERVKLRVHVQNTGDGPALDTWVNLRNLSGDAVFLHAGREHIKSLAPGETKTVDLDVELRNRPENGAAELQLRVSDGKLGESVAERLVFAAQDEAVAVTDESGTVAADGAVDLFASPVGPARVIARADAGTKFKINGAVGDWYRLDTGEGGFAFARKGSVSSSSGKASASAVKPVLEVSPPQVALQGAVTQTDGESIHISGKASDQEAVRDVFITVFNPSRNLFGDQEKVFYQASTDPSSGQLDFAADVPLTPGNNLIEVHARQNDEIVATKRMWVLRTSGLAQARADSRKIEGKGKLRVDTFK